MGHVTFSAGDTPGFTPVYLILSSEVTLTPQLLGFDAFRDELSGRD